MPASASVVSSARRLRKVSDTICCVRSNHAWVSASCAASPVRAKSGVFSSERASSTDVVPRYLFSTAISREASLVKSCSTVMTSDSSTYNAMWSLGCAFASSFRI